MPDLCGVAEHAAATAACAADAYLAGTVKHADEAALQHERGRGTAIGHRLWVAVASFAGPTGDGHGKTAGRSGSGARTASWSRKPGHGPGTSHQQRSINDV